MEGGPETEGAYLRQCWYVAAWSDEVTRTPLRRVMLDEPVVLFRRQDGSAAALADLCPHRFLPLSLGKLEGDEIACSYHGLRFNTEGACTLVPHGDGTVPRSARVARYTLAERNGVVWIWMGAPDRADVALIPADFDILADPAFTAVRGMLQVQADYQLVTDNLLDLSHAQFLHAGLRVANPKRLRHEVRQEAGKVISCFWRDEGEPNALMRLLGWPVGKVGDSRAHMHWNAPSLMYLDVGVTDVGGDVRDGIAAPSLHLLTPETAGATHYFFAFLRNVRLDDNGLSDQVRALGMQAFAMEDKPVIEAQQRALRGRDIMRMGPVLLPTDAGATRARRVLHSLLQAEAAIDSAGAARL